MLDDLRVRESIYKGYEDAGISRIDIERGKAVVVVTIHTARPGIVIGRGGTRVEELRKELVLFVRKEIGPIAAPDIIHWAPGLPKTRSGKIMRRILRKIAADESEQLGDISTLADPSVVELLRSTYIQMMKK